MRFVKSPSPREAAVILRELANQPPKMAARRIDKPLVLYGASKLGKMACELLDFIGEKPAFVVDSQAQRYRDEPFWEGRNLVTPVEVSATVRSTHLLAVSIATLPFSELAATLAASGWRDIVPFYDIAEAYRAIYPLSNGWIWTDTEEEDLERTESVLSLWGDDTSRAHHLQFLAWHRLREDWTFNDAPVVADNRYFIPEVQAVMGQCPRFLDVGAHYGEVAAGYLRERGERGFERIWMIEPDPRNSAHIRAWMSGMSSDQAGKIELLSCSVADASGQRKFFSGIGYASQFSATGGDVVEARTIDELRLEPSFIKLHLEGWELDALKGAEETLHRNLPTIAMTTYHNELGVWKAPHWLMQNFVSRSDGYRLLFRLHSWSGTGGVMYCIPK